jgi:hypothetical protein
MSHVILRRGILIVNNTLKLVFIIAQSTYEFRGDMGVLVEKK